ncbi:hypothetical protein [Achromobacter kerstersii]
MLRKKSLFVIAALFATLFVLLLPVRPVWEGDASVRLVATGQKNPESKSAEIWVDAKMSRELLANIVHQDPAWETREGFLLSFRNQPGAIEAKIRVVPDTKLTLTQHSYSGIVELTVNGQSQRIDLYSAVPGSVTIDLAPLVQLSLSVSQTADKLIANFLGAFVFTLLAGWAMGRRGKLAPLDPAADAIHWRRIFLLALPALLIYAVSLLIFWPAQMSPDSITQWNQLVTGRFDDSHPVLSTLFYAVPYAIHPSPVALMVFQGVLLALVGAAAVNEAMAWGLGRRVAVAAAFLFPLFPPNFLLASTMWKDVSFGITLLLFTVLAARQVRLRFSLSNGSLAALTIVGFLVVGLRHNGLLIAPPFFLLLLYFAPGRTTRWKVGGALVAQLAAFVVFKTLVLSAMGASGIGPHYKAIYALHVIGAMEKAGVHWNEQDKALVGRTLPEQAWADNYRCDSVVPLFWSPEISYRFLAEHQAELNVLALKSILRHPGVFLEHQLCLTGLVWRIGAGEEEWMTLSPLIIYDMPLGQKLGLKASSKLPWLKEQVTDLHETVLAKGNSALRPALYVWLGLFALVLLIARRGKGAVLIAVPLGLNCLSLLIMVGSQDYRYMWPSVVASLFVMLLGISLVSAGRAAKVCDPKV